MIAAGRRLRAARVRSGLSLRDVAYLTAQIAKHKRNRRYSISASHLTLMENGNQTPTIYVLASLAKIYELPLRKILVWYGVD